MLAMYKAVAYIRTGSSIIVTCLFGPIRKAVLPHERHKLGWEMQKKKEQQIRNTKMENFVFLGSK